MATVARYIVVRAESLHALEDEVNKRLPTGFTPWGDLKIIPVRYKFLFFQTMVRYSDEP